MSEEPTYLEIVAAIIAAYGPEDRRWVEWWSDVYDGRAPQIYREFWRTLRLRNPQGSLDQVVADWTPAELQALYRKLLNRGRMPGTGDIVRVRSNQQTIEDGYAGRSGTCHNSPSVGPSDDDIDVAVQFDDGNLAWFRLSEVELVERTAT